MGLIDAIASVLAALLVIFLLYKFSKTEDVQHDDTEFP